MDKDDRVREFLKRRGSPEHIVRGGLGGLVESWEKVVESVAKGYRLTLDDYLNDMDGRQLLEEALDVAPEQERRKALRQVQRIDAEMRSLLEPAGKCLWGEEVAEEEGWTPEDNWWYFSRPTRADSELLEEIDEL